MVGVRWVGVVGALCALSVSWACGRADAPAASAPSGPRQQEQSVVTLPPDSPQLKQIRVDPVQLADMPTDELVAPARVIPNPNRISRLLPQVQGRVMRVMAQLGDTVEQGQPLVGSTARMPMPPSRPSSRPRLASARLRRPWLRRRRISRGPRTSTTTKPSPRRTCWAPRMTSPRPRRESRPLARPSSRPGASSSFSASPPRGRVSPSSFARPSPGRSSK
jgi:hypothetical protein